MFDKFLPSSLKVYYLSWPEVYEKNIEIKSSVFQDASEWGASVVDQSIVGGRNTKNAPPVRQSAVREVIIEEKEDEKIVGKKPVLNNNKCKNILIIRGAKEDNK